MTKRLLSLLAVLLLAACATKVDQVALQRAVNNLDNAVLSGNKAPESALDAYKALYKKYPNDPIAVSGYADALRRIGRADKAADVLKPFVENTSSFQLPGPIFLAYMRLMIDQNYEKDAEARLRTRIKLPALLAGKGASMAQMYNLLGVSLAKQGRKPEAEQAFNTALATWDGRPGVVEANLEQLKH